MSDYKKLVRYLKKVKVYCASCSLNVYTEDGDMMCKWGGEDRCLFIDAAAAIEELQARLGEAENSVERWKDMYLTKHEPKMEVQE